MPDIQLEAIARIRAQWKDVVQAVVAACQGDVDAAAQLPAFLDQMSRKDDWRALADALRRILNGERDPIALFASLDDTDALIAGDVLRALGVDVPLMGDEDGGDMVTLDDFLSTVVVACRPDAPDGLAEQLLGATRGMAAQPTAPAGMRELGLVLNAILSGERDPDLADLPPDLADKVRGVLAQLDECRMSNGSFE
jgi:hypothetical protein